jgi:thioredoxin reductase
MASIRAVVPGLISEDQLFHPIEPGFAAYPKDAFKLVLASATGVDTAAKAAVVRSADGNEERLPYDYLVLATGARSASDGVPWKPQETHEATVDMLRKTAEKVRAARHIVVAGAGPTGCEVAAEIKHEYKGDKEVVLLASGPAVLGGDAVAGDMESEVAALGVRVTKNAWVEGARATADGKTEVALRDGSRILTDLYLPTMGLVPNTEFVDKKHLGEGNYVDVDEFYHVRGADDVWACGDIVSKPRAAFMTTDKQVCNNTSPPHPPSPSQISSCSSRAKSFLHIQACDADCNPPLSSRPPVSPRTSRTPCSASPWPPSSSCQSTSSSAPPARTAGPGDSGGSRCRPSWRGPPRAGRWGSRGRLSMSTGRSGEVEAGRRMIRGRVRGRGEDLGVSGLRLPCVFVVFL